MEAVALAPREPRKNLMLAATIAAGNFRAPVRVRNLSPNGAMVDGPALPAPGANFQLVRLELSVGASVVWRQSGRCGLRLAEEIDVDEWVSGVRRAQRFVSLGQSRVDRIQAAVRQGEELPEEAAAPAQARPMTPLGKRLAREIAQLRVLLDKVGETLTDDVHVLTKHEQALQDLDMAAQTLAALAEIAQARDGEAAIAKIAMHDLRSRMSDNPTLT